MFFEKNMIRNLATGQLIIMEGYAVKNYWTCFPEVTQENYKLHLEERPDIFVPPNTVRIVFHKKIHDLDLFSMRGESPLFGESVPKDIVKNYFNKEKIEEILSPTTEKIEDFLRKAKRFFSIIE